VMGFQNAYRQFIASCVVLAAISNPTTKRYVLFALSAAVHNATLLFLPLLFAYRRFMPSRAKKKRFALSSIAILLMIPLAATTKSSGFTGLDLALAYVASMIIAFFIAAALSLWKMHYNLF